MHACTYSREVRACSRAQTDNMRCCLARLFFGRGTRGGLKTQRTHPCTQLHQDGILANTYAHIFRPYSSAHYLSQLHLPCCVQVFLWLEYVGKCTVCVCVCARWGEVGLEPTLSSSDPLRLVLVLTAHVPSLQLHGTNLAFRQLGGSGGWGRNEFKMKGSISWTFIIILYRAGKGTGHGYHVWQHRVKWEWTGASGN